VLVAKRRAMRATVLVHPLFRCAEVKIALRFSEAEDKKR
jgi:hypothetical protein